jgi:hypothetical protein
MRWLGESWEGLQRMPVSVVDVAVEMYNEAHPPQDEG